MGRQCSQCSQWLSNSSFSRNQWRKGDGHSRCGDCVAGVYWNECHECSRQFQSSNALNMHMQVHRARNVACPCCGEVRFKSGANAVQHVESGYCRSCRGPENARRQIYGFAKSKATMCQFLNETPRLTNGHDYSQQVPDFPYHCPACAKSFRHLSQLLQHQDQKHGNHHFMLAY